MDAARIEWILNGKSRASLEGKNFMKRMHISKAGWTNFVERLMVLFMYWGKGTGRGIRDVLHVLVFWPGPQIYCTSVELLDFYYTLLLVSMTSRLFYSGSPAQSCHHVIRVSGFLLNK